LVGKKVSSSVPTLYRTALYPVYRAAL